jgi:p-aminobenzoyl-glutamate transporter AbgT
MVKPLNFSSYDVLHQQYLVWFFICSDFIETFGFGFTLNGCIVIVTGMELLLFAGLHLCALVVNLTVFAAFFGYSFFFLAHWD